ncbi:MAG: DNA polymerase III subunit delta [Chloroflexi bacterium]|nr:MAG: DNA polymerase III subunit delta [Chloroflexota bacterium]
MFYIFHGEDTHSQKESLAKLTARLGDPGLLDLNTTRFAGYVSFRDLSQACDAMPFLAPVRLVIVAGLLSHNKVDKAYLETAADYLPHMPESTRLVFLEPKKVSATNLLIKLAHSSENGYVKEFPQPEGRDLEKWVQKRAAEKEGKISPRAVHMLATNIGSNLPLLDNELEKLIIYKGEAEILPADVERLSPYLAEASIFDLVDALGNRNEKKAAQLLQKKFSEGTDPFYLFSMFVRQFRLLIQVKEAAQEGHRPPAISKQLHIHSFVAGKLYQQSQQFSLPQLEQIYKHLLKVDVQVKTGQNDLTTALTLLVAVLTSPN